MRNERVNINLDNNNKKIGLVKEELPKATVSLTVNGHDLKFAIGNSLDDKHFPPAPPNNCNGVDNAASYAALVKSNAKCGPADTYSQLRVADLNTMFGIKVQGAPSSELKIENVTVEDKDNLDILKLLMGTQEIDLLGNLDNLDLLINQDGLDLLMVQAIQNGFLIGDLDGNNLVNASDALMALKISVGLITVNHANNKIIDEQNNEIVGAYDRLKATHKFLKDNFSYSIGNDEHGNFEITAPVALALLQIAVQFTNNNFKDDSMPPNTDSQ